MLTTLSDLSSDSEEDTDIELDDEDMEWCCHYHLKLYRNSPRRFFREDGHILSRFALKSLDRAIDEFHSFVKGTIYSNIDKSINIEREIIKFHLVPMARKMFKNYVESFGAKCKYRKLNRNQQNECKMYKKRKSLVTFCCVKIDGNIRDNLLKSDEEIFDDFYEMNELSLSYFLNKMLRLPLNESIGWILNENGHFSEIDNNMIGSIPNYQFIQKQAKLINDIDSKYLSLNTYLFIQNKKLKIEFVKNSKEFMLYVENQNRKKFGNVKSHKITEYFESRNRKRKRSNEQNSTHNNMNKRQRIV